VLKPSVSSQLMSQTGMGRPGGAASRGSSSAPASKGKGWASMENALLKKKQPNPKGLAAQKKPARQYFTDVAGGSGGNKPTSDSTPTTSPTGLRRVQANGRNAMSFKGK